MLEAMKPEFIAPFVGYLASEQIEDTGTVHEVFGGYAARLRWQRTYGYVYLTRLVVMAAHTMEVSVTSRPTFAHLPLPETLRNSAQCAV
jgi:multifunctional beta-oxidation protein